MLFSALFCGLSWHSCGLRHLYWSPCSLPLICGQLADWLAARWSQSARWPQSHDWQTIDVHRGPWVEWLISSMRGRSLSGRLAPLWFSSIHRERPELFWLRACVIFANIPWAKANHMVKSRYMEFKNKIPFLIGKVSTLVCKTGMRIEKVNICGYFFQPIL